MSLDTVQISLSDTTVSEYSTDPVYIWEFVEFTEGLYASPAHVYGTRLLPESHLRERYFQVMFARIPEAIAEKYTVQDQKAVARIIRFTPGMADVLLEAHEKIVEIFGFSEVVLEPDYDADASNRGLIVSIMADIDVDESLERLKGFDQNWWLDNLDRAHGRLTITLG